MQKDEREVQTYRVGKINFIVRPVYKKDEGRSIFSILLELMKSDVKQG